MNKKGFKRSGGSLDKLMGRIERLFLAVVIGILPPVLFFLGGWWGSTPFVPEKQIPYYALGGLSVGLRLDIFFSGNGRIERWGCRWCGRR